MADPLNLVPQFPKFLEGLRQATKALDIKGLDFRYIMVVNVSPLYKAQNPPIIKPVGNFAGGHLTTRDCPKCHSKLFECTTLEWCVSHTCDYLGPKPEKSGGFVEEEF